MFLVTLVPSVLVLLIIFGLYQKSKALLGLKSLGTLLFSTTWSPLKGEFGFLPFIMGTLWVTAVALVIAIPVSLFTAIYPLGVRPEGLPGARQAGHRPARRHPLGRLRGLGHHGHRPLRRQRPGPALRRLLQRLQHPGRRHRPGHHDLPDHHPRLARGFCLDPRRPPGNVPLPRRDPVGDGPPRRPPEGRPGDPGRGHPRPVPGVRRNHGRAHGRRQRPLGPQVPVPARIPPAGPHRQQLRGDDVHPPL